jgi:hypothetical protein
MNKERNFLLKILLFVQISITMMLTMSSLSFSNKKNQILDLLTSILAFGFINNLDEYFGTLVLKHIKVHHNEILLARKDDFLFFDYTDVDYKVWYSWFNMIFISSSLAGIFNIFIKKWKC